MIWSLVVLACGVGFVGLLIAQLLPHIAPKNKPTSNKPAADAATRKVAPLEQRTVVVPLPVLCGQDERRPGHSTTWVPLDGRLPTRG